MADTKLQFIPHMDTKSCFCFQSKTGCLIIGYIGAILSAILAGVFSIAAVSLLFSDKPFLSFIQSILFLGICMASSYVYYLLIQGVEKQEPRKMYLWIYLTYIELIGNVLFIGLGFIILIVLVVFVKSPYVIDGKEYSIPWLLFYLCLSAILEGFSYHIFASVVTYCQDLLSTQSGGRIYNP